MLPNDVKLVIWDLDDTFWQGTLTEGGVSAIDRNHDLVVELSKRGIVNSICSKNDYDQAKEKLAELGIWDHFVFSHIQFSPKGKAVADILERAALRPQNTLFIDDNPTNLEEVKFFNPGIMTAHPQEILDDLLNHPRCAGKHDPDMTRLAQYRSLQKKFEEKSESALSNEEFLRTSEIRVRIDYEIDANFDRIVELINRTNQLNYTKKRLNTPEKLERFRELINRTYGIHAGCVHATDRYGDYGLIGFFMFKRNPRGARLMHFVFSCRTMNMGIEQYVYELLDRPKIEIAEPVSYPIETHEPVDWINNNAEGEDRISDAAGQKLVLLGGCDLLQLASYCSPDRIEFVNRVEGDVKVYYEDPGFIVGDRETIRNSNTLRSISCWSHNDALRFDQGIADAGVILLSMWPAMNGEYFTSDDGVELRLGAKDVPRIQAADPAWFEKHLEPLPLDAEQRLARVQASFDSIRDRVGANCQVFLMGVSTIGDVSRGHEARRSEFNRFCREYCRRNPAQFHFVDFDKVVPLEYLVNGIHFSRQGYFVIARYILDLVQRSGEGDAALPLGRAEANSPEGVTGLSLA